MNNETAAVEVRGVPVAAPVHIAGQCGAGVVCKAMDLALESGRRVPRPVVDVRDGSVRVSSPDGSPAVVHRVEFVIEETPDE